MVTLSGTNQAAYVYDGAGLRVKKCVPDCASPTTTTVYVFSGAKVTAEYENGAAVNSPTREYIYSGGALIAIHEGSSLKFQMTDHLSARIVTDTSGNVVEQRGHFPYGESWYAKDGAGNNITAGKWQFTSYERDAETGALANDYAMARTYTNRFGRFSSPDPLSGSIGNPQSLNRYGYTLNDPINLTDPLGLDPTVCWTNGENVYCSGNYGSFDGGGSGVTSLGSRDALTLLGDAFTSSLSDPDGYYDQETGRWMGESSVDPGLFALANLLAGLSQGGGEPGGGTPQRIRDIVNAALQQPLLSDCLHEFFGPGTILTNQNLPYLNMTKSSAQLEAMGQPVGPGEMVAGTIQTPVPATGRGTALVASELWFDSNQAVRTYLHETANILAIQLFTNSGVQGVDRAYRGPRGAPPSRAQTSSADRDIGNQFENCVFPDVTIVVRP